MAMTQLCQPGVAGRATACSNRPCTRPCAASTRARPRNRLTPPDCNGMKQAALLHQQKSGHGRRRACVLFRFGSDGSGEFDEDCWESVVQVEVDGQLEVSAAQVLDERMDD